LIAIKRSYVRKKKATWGGWDKEKAQPDVGFERGGSSHPLEGERDKRYARNRQGGGLDVQKKGEGPSEEKRREEKRKETEDGRERVQTKPSPTMGFFLKGWDAAGPRVRVTTGNGVKSVPGVVIAKGGERRKG